MEATDDYFCDIFNMMIDENRYFSHFIKELVKLYKEFNPAFDDVTLSYDLTDTVFELLAKQPVEIQDIRSFLIRKKEDIQLIISPSNGYIFQQPVSLLILYYFEYHRTFLNSNWPLNK